MTETNLAWIQRVVSNSDTKAGQKLRYIITRAQADEPFARKIVFTTCFNTENIESVDLSALFSFGDSPEGHDYWWQIHIQIMKNRYKRPQDDT